MLASKAIIILFLLIAILDEIYSAHTNVFLNSGWYKTRRKGDKKTLHKVQGINPSTVTDTSYLKVSGIIPILTEGSIKDLKHLEDLTISSCGIQEIQPGAFQNLPKLSKLNLKENGIERVESGVFNFLQITVLFLNKNVINTIKSDAFDNMPNLTKIKLNSNKISAWDSNWFKNTPLLSLVSVRRNFIKEIPANAFQHLSRKNATRDEKKLPDVKIFLSKNEISAIDPLAFRGFNKLGQIWLDRNELTQLNPIILTGVSHIHVFNVAKNNLTVIPPDLFKNVKSVKVFDITANHRIKCVPVEVISVVRQFQATNNRKLECSCVKTLQEKAKELGHEIITDEQCKM